MPNIDISKLDAMTPDTMRAPEASPDVPWSHYQEAFFNHLAETDDNLVVEAVAGSGKTTTLLEGMRRLGTKDVLFLAFNKSIQQELASRVPMGVTTMTLNALGHRILSPKIQARRVDMYKPHNILRDMLSKDIYKDYGFGLARALSSARANGIGIRTPKDHEAWLNFLLDGDTDFPEGKENEFAEILRIAFDHMIDTIDNSFDFDDQLYMPIFLNLTFPRYDVVFVDEAQDLSYINHMQLRALAERGARIIAVGDSHQAIYAFRGADTKSMTNLAHNFDATILPLSICYRCDLAIVQRAKRLVPHIEAREAAPDGEIIIHDEMPEPADFAAGSMIICRNNAPLFSLALSFLRARVPCYMVMDFAKDLTKLIERLGATKSQELQVRLHAWADEEIAKAERLGRDHLIDIIEDKLNCLLPFCEEYEYAIQIKGAIQQLTESTTGPRLSTVHKAKGLEANDCYILRPDLLPSPRALMLFEQYGDSSALAQEKNLEYVAITRAKHRLHYLPAEQR